MVGLWYYNQQGVTELLIMSDPNYMIACVLCQLKSSGFSILTCEKNLGLWPRPFFTPKNIELLGLYPILMSYTWSTKKAMDFHPS